MAVVKRIGACPESRGWRGRDSKPVDSEWSVKPSEALLAQRATIRSVVEAYHGHNARVFGSVVHGSDTGESDLDILIDPTSEMTLFDIGAIRYELRILLGVPVDVDSVWKTIDSDLPQLQQHVRIVGVPVMKDEGLRGLIAGGAVCWSGVKPSLAPPI